MRIEEKMLILPAFSECTGEIKPPVSNFIGKTAAGALLN